jgi:hypothetical protein
LHRRLLTVTFAVVVALAASGPAAAGEPPNQNDPCSSGGRNIGRARLVLVTCGGPYNRTTGHYRDNIVVTAVPV